MLVPYKHDPTLVIILPADGLAPNGARPSAGTVLTEKSDIFLSLAFYDSKMSSKMVVKILQILTAFWVLTVEYVDTDHT